MRKHIAIVAALSLMMIVQPMFARGGLRARELARDTFVPQPRLISPSTQDVDLTGKATLTFEWSPHEGDPLQRDYYDFRLYKGYEMVEGTLIFKNRVPANNSSIVLSSTMFQNGQLYTWSLKQVYTGSVKSLRSYSSFKVKK